MSLQRALRDMVTPSLRSIAINCRGAAACIRFVYDEAVTEELLELVSEGETEVLADLCDDIATTFVVEYVPVEVERSLSEAGERWYYLRRERSE